MIRFNILFFHCSAALGRPRSGEKPRTDNANNINDVTTAATTTTRKTIVIIIIVIIMSNGDDGDVNVVVCLFVPQIQVLG